MSMTELLAKSAGMEKLRRVIYNQQKMLRAYIEEYLKNTLSITLDCYKELHSSV